MSSLDAPRSQRVFSLPTKLQKKITPFFRSMAASILLLIMLVAIFTPSNSAIAAMDLVIQHIDDLGDRMYTLRVKSENQTREARGRETLKPRFEFAELYLRDADQFVFIEQREKGPGIIKGSNGKESWQVADREISTSSNQNAIKIPLSSNGGSLVSQDIAATLEQLKDGYEFVLEHDQPLSDMDGRWSKITASKVDLSMEGAKRVVMYYNPENFHLQRLMFHRVHLPGERDFWRISLNLHSVTPLSEDFFDVHAHTSEDEV